MVHISKKLADSEQSKKTIFSFEFYPPKTGQVCCYVFFFFVAI